MTARRALAALLLSALLLGPALAQAPASGPTQVSPPAPTQLDRIEHKLDAVLRRLDQRGQAHQGQQQGPETPAGAAQGASTAPEAANPSPAPLAGPAASVAASDSYKPGALAVVRPAPHNEQGLGEVPADAVGGFVYTGGPVPLSDIHDRGVRYTGPVGIELQGWLRAREAGRYQIGADLTAHFALGAFIAPVCRLQAWLEGRSLDQATTRVASPGKQDAGASLVLGAELQPGLYRLRVWIACTAPQGVTVTAEPLLKAPSELNLRPVVGEDLLHRQG